MTQTNEFHPHMARMEEALRQSAALDLEQHHNEAAQVLRASLLGSGTWTGGEVPEGYLDLVKSISREEQRQLRRHALLRSYLEF